MYRCFCLTQLVLGAALLAMGGVLLAGVEDNDRQPMTNKEFVGYVAKADSAVVNVAGRNNEPRDVCFTITDRKKLKQLASYLASENAIKRLGDSRGCASYAHVKLCESGKESRVISFTVHSDGCIFGKGEGPWYEYELQDGRAYEMLMGYRDCESDNNGP